MASLALCLRHRLLLFCRCSPLRIPPRWGGHGVKHGPRGAASGWNLREGETRVYEACASSASKEAAGGPSIPTPRPSSLLHHSSQGRTPATVLRGGGLARGREDLLIFLVSSQLSSLQSPRGKDLQHHVSLLPLPASAPLLSPLPPLPARTSPAPHPCQLSPLPSRLSPPVPSQAPASRAAGRARRGGQ